MGRIQFWLRQSSWWKYSFIQYILLITHSNFKLVNLIKSLPVSTSLYAGLVPRRLHLFSSKMKFLKDDCKRIEEFPPGHYFSSKFNTFIRWYSLALRLVADMEMYLFSITLDANLYRSCWTSKLCFTQNFAEISTSCTSWTCSRHGTCSYAGLTCNCTWGIVCLHSRHCWKWL